MDDLTLAAEFPPRPASMARLVEGVLKGADFEKKLVARSHDGLADRAALSEGGRRRAGRARQAGRWRIAQRIDHPEPAPRMRSPSPISKAAPTPSSSSTPARRRRGASACGIDNVDDLERALRA